MSEKTTSKPQHQPSLLRLFRNRFIAGLFVVLPIYITYALLKWLYDLLYSNALQPITYGLRKLWGLGEAEADLNIYPVSYTHLTLPTIYSV